MIVVRVDEATLAASETTLYSDLAFLAARGQRPLVVAPTREGARAVVRTINRTGDIAVGISGADAGMMPARGNGIGAVQPRLLQTLLSSGYIPVVEPLAMGFAGTDISVGADDVARALACALNASRALFFHDAGGVVDRESRDIIAELTPAEALALADDASLPQNLRDAIRAAALGVRGGVESADILDGRIAHASIVELLTERHIGTRVLGSVFLAG